jgi:hypothetical protein
MIRNRRSVAEAVAQPASRTVVAKAEDVAVAIFYFEFLRLVERHFRPRVISAPLALNT